MNRKIIVLGNGIAGFSAVEEIRKFEKDEQIVMISEENEAPYLRPLLSKTYCKTLRRDRIHIAQAEWYDKNQIQRMEGIRIRKIRIEQRCVELESGMLIGYDSCIYALGASCFVPPFSGANLDGVMTVRTVADFNRIRRYMAVARRIVIIGGGVIGLEMAWEIAQMGCEVTILEAAPRLMGRLLDSQSAEYLVTLVHNMGIAVHVDVKIAELTGAGPSLGRGRGKCNRVTGVKLSDETWFPADLVIVSCGVRANIDVAKESGIDCDRGILVNDFMETSIPGIFAAGDCIQWKTPNPGLWNYAKMSGIIAGYHSRLPDKKQPFSPLSDPVILSAMGTSLFSIGNIEEDGNETSTVECKRTSGRGIHFRVNQHMGDMYSYKKKFYRGGKLCGAVLIGDLSEMMEIGRKLARQSVFENCFPTDVRSTLWEICPR